MYETYMKEWEKHLERAGEKLKSANILFADYDIFYEPSKEEAESVIEEADAFLERIEDAIEEITKEA